MSDEVPGSLKVYVLHNVSKHLFEKAGSPKRVLKHLHKLSHASPRRTSLRSMATGAQRMHPGVFGLPRRCGVSRLVVTSASLVVTGALLVVTRS